VGRTRVDVVLESTGFFTSRADAQKHIVRAREGGHLGAGDEPT
jgi:glyceraldehyde-3-phosphate dehydrogenase/erythrose-4-phosphate dehydrogenase